MAKELILRGFRKLSFFPVVEDTYEKYEVGERIYLEGAKEMTREQDTSEDPIYADDGLYANIVNFNGIKSTITVADTSLPLLAKLGFGEFDETTKEFKANPQGLGKSFAVSFLCEMLGGECRMFKFFNFTISSIQEDSVKTKGKDGSSSAIKIDGIFTKRKIDDEIYFVKDSEDKNFDWINTIGNLPTTPPTTQSTRKAYKEA